MKIKTIVTALLIIFAITAVVVAIVRTANNQSSIKAQPTNSPTTESPTSAPSGEKIVAYYFHRNMRCLTCRTIEKYTHETLKAEFASGLAEGQIEWKVINYEQPANQHYIKDFGLVSASVVITKIRDGKIVQWKNLDKVWQLVRNKPAFMSYIKSEVEKLQEKGQ